MLGFGPLGFTAIGMSVAVTLASVPGSAPGASLSGGGTISGGAASGGASIPGSAPGALLSGTGTISGGAASGGASQGATITVPASRTAVFAGHPRVAVFNGTGPVHLTKVAADQLYFVGNFTKDLTDGATTAASASPVTYVASGVVVIEAPVMQGYLCVMKLGALDPAGGQITLHVKCANGEEIDGTIILAALDDRTQQFGKDPDDKRYFAFDVSADLALSSNTTIASLQTPVASGVSSLTTPAIQGSKAVVMLGGLDLTDGATNSCKLTMVLANSEVINRTAYFSRQDH